MNKKFLENLFNQKCALTVGNIGFFNNYSIDGSDFIEKDNIRLFGSIETVSTLGSNIFPLPIIEAQNTLRVYASNFAHDFMGSVNGISSFLTIFKDRAEGLESLKDFLEDSRDLISYNLALVGIGENQYTTLEEVKEVVEVAFKRYYSNYSIKSSKADIYASISRVKAALNIVIGNLFADTKAEIEVNIEKDSGLKISFHSFKSFIKPEKVVEIFSFDNTSAFNGLSLLPMIADYVNMIIENDRNTLEIIWKNNG